tara:strand:- start:1137 stop:1586 length:450 start_codon:yes stop_codon:yes gene_type:complete
MADTPATTDDPFDLYSVDSGQIRTGRYQDALADLTRQQFEDYKSRYLPVQEKLFSLATDDSLLTEQLERNQQNIDSNFKIAKESEDRQLARFGVNAANSKQDNNNNNLLKSLTTASVNNETRSSVDDLQNKILTGQGGATSTLADIGNV